MKLEFSRQIFGNGSNTKFHQNSFSGSRDVLCGRTDRHDEANSRFRKFCESTITRIKYFFNATTLASSKQNAKCHKRLLFSRRKRIWHPCVTSTLCYMITSVMRNSPVVPLNSRLASLTSENYKGEKYEKL